MNEILNAFLRGMQQGIRAYFAPVRWAVNALRHAADDAFSGNLPSQSRIKLSR